MLRKNFLCIGLLFGITVFCIFSIKANAQTMTVFDNIGSISSEVKNTNNTTNTMNTGNNVTNTTVTENTNTAIADAVSTDNKALDTPVKYIMIGDSRFVSMAISVRGLNGSYDGEIIEEKDDELWVCKSGTFCRPYKETILNNLMKYENNKDSITIVYALGVNNVGDIQEDIDFLLGLQEQGWDVYICDILPVIDSVFTYGSFTETQVYEANQKIESSGLNVIHFHDTCLTNFSYHSPDGLHFDTETNWAWYECIRDQLKYDRITKWLDMEQNSFL